VVALPVVTSTGCGMVINGFSDSLTAQSPTPGAKVYVDGFDATKAPIEVPNDRPHVVLVRAPGYADRVIDVFPSVSGAVIALDVIFAVPSLFATIYIDSLLSYWFTIDAPEEPITLAKATKTERARPVYFVGGAKIESRPGAGAQAAPSASAPAESEAPSAPASATPSGSAPAPSSAPPPHR